MQEPTPDSTASSASSRTANPSPWASSEDPSVRGTGWTNADVSTFPIDAPCCLILASRVATDIRSGPLNVHRRIFDYLTSKYPHPGHKFTNGAIPATGECDTLREGGGNALISGWVQEATTLQPVLRSISRKTWISSLLNSVRPAAHLRLSSNPSASSHQRHAPCAVAGGVRDVDSWIVGVAKQAGDYQHAVGSPSGGRDYALTLAQYRGAHVRSDQSRWRSGACGIDYI
jgi:hypothetical protein